MYIQVVNGLLHAHPTTIKTKDNFVELLLHELSRVFLDRLIDGTDRKIFHEIILDQFHDVLKMKWSRDRLFTNNALFGYFIEVNVIEQKRIYQCIRDQNKLLEILEVDLILTH